MLDSRISQSVRRQMSFWGVTTLLGLVAIAPSDVVAKGRTHSLQGLFCNAAEQIDETLTHMRRGMSPRSAVAFTNRDGVVCTFVDLLHYVVDQPVVINEIRGSFPLFKYQGTLVAAIVGNAYRPLSPPVQIFFAIPERLESAPIAGRA